MVGKIGATTFERNSAVRRSVVIRDSVDGGSGGDQVGSCDAA